MIGSGYSDKLKRGCVIWNGNNLFLSPSQYWMHDCIWYWTWKWYPYLMISIV